MGELKEILGFKSLLLITINAIMGTGIFFLVAIGSREAGPASLLSWFFLSFLSVYIAACFGELTSMFPKSGGVYEFCKQAYGKFPSFMIGWISIIVGNLTIAMLISGALQYLLPGGSQLIRILLSLLCIIGFNYVAYRGMKLSAVMLSIFALITIGTLLAIIIPGLFSISLDSFTPFFARGIAPIFLVTFLLAETFFGWETTTFLAEETRDSKRVMPKAILLATVCVAILALALVITSFSLMPWKNLALSEAPLRDLAFVLFGNTGKTIFALLVYLSIVGTIATWIVSAPRLLLAMARDKLFLKQFAIIHEKHHTPSKAIIFQTVLSAAMVIIGFGEHEAILTNLLPLVLLMYAAVLLSVTVLRIKQAHTPRHFRVWFPRSGPVICALVLLAIIGLWLSSSPQAWMTAKIGGSLIILGIPVYFLLEMYYDPEWIARLNNSLAFFTLVTENISLPKKVRRQLILLLGNCKDKTVLELGCTVGTLTKDLAKEVGSSGKIIATDISLKNIEIAQGRLQQYPHVTVIHHNDPNSLHPQIPELDAVISVGHMSTVQETTKFLRELNQKLKLHDRISMLEYDHFYWILPNIPRMNSDESIKSIFLHTGFQINVIRKRGLLWQYVYVYGKKVAEV